MSLTPEDIEHQVFKERFRGYDQDEVDRFLDRVSEGLSELAREREQLADQVRVLEGRAGEKTESEKLLQRTLVSAQRAADETVAEARAHAEQTVQEARDQAEEILAEAHRQVDEDARRVAEDEQRAREVLAFVRRAVDEFARFRREYRQQVEGFIAEQLAVFDRIGELPDIPDGLRSLSEREEPAGGEAQAGEVGHVSWDHGREM